MTLSDEQRTALESHHDWAIAAAITALESLRRIPLNMRTAQTINQENYWRNLARGFRWSRSFIGKNLKAKNVMENTDVCHVCGCPGGWGGQNNRADDT